MLNSNFFLGLFPRFKEKTCRKSLAFGNSNHPDKGESNYIGPFKEIGANNCHDHLHDPPLESVWILKCQKKLGQGAESGGQNVNAFSVLLKCHFFTDQPAGIRDLFERI